MGTCFSKKGPSSSSSSSKVAISATTPDPSKHILNPDPQPVEVRVKKPSVQLEEVRAEKEEESSVKKEMLVTKHRKSHDRAPPHQHKVPDGVVIGSIVSSSHESADPEEVGKDVITSTVSSSHTPATGIRTSSCTKEEVDAILIQCGRLSHNTPSKAASGSAERSRKYSGSKRSYDFDSDHNGADDYCEDNDGAAEERRHREMNRQSRASPQGRRRRTPSREREEQNQRSNSKERGSGSRRVSRSPGKRSGNSSTATNGTNGRPGKMVSVPASLVMDKSNNGCGEPAVAATSAVKRINVKRNGGEAGTVGSRGVASPRAQSPARGSNENVRARSPARGSNENVRARSPARTNANGSSRKAEQSPYRRNPLSEIDPNSLAYVNKAAQTNANNSSRVHIKSKEFEADGQRLTVGQGANHKTSKVVDCPSKEQTQMTRSVTVTAVPPTLTRSRSSRRSQDLDMNQETILNANPSYTSLLLEDIQNFHQKSTLNPTSTSEAVDDLNCGTGSNLSCTFSEGRMGLPTDLFSRTEHSLPLATILAGKKRAQHKEAFVESEVIVDDDLMEPSLHKYVTVRRGGRGTQLEEEESSGSNSIVGGTGGGQLHGGVSSSSWEPNSADSTDRWTSRSNTKDIDHQHTCIGHGKVGGNRGSQAVVVAAST